MKKSLSSLFVLLFLTGFLNAASLKDSVCIVRSNLSEKSTTFLQNYGSSLKKQGYGKYATIIDNYLEGSFGSGFVYEGSNGKKYVITNRHVVISGDTVTIQFEKDDGTYDEYKDLPVLAIDDDLDVAVIELPSTARKSGISVKTSAVSDGEDVWTAGFPGLGGKPAWQFGKGSVTNSSARIDELVSSSITTIIQHSAQVDGGNSGGPLLVKDSSTSLGYRVVGINTWKAANRENTNFAIPMKAVKTFVDNVIARKNSSGLIENRIEKFNNSIANKEETFGKMSRFISNDMVSSLSSKTFLNIVNTASSEAQDIILANFIVDPLEGIRYAIAAYVWNSFRRRGELIAYTTGTPEAVDSAYNVTFTIDGKTPFTSTWIKEQGLWKISDFNGIASGSEITGASTVTCYDPFVLDLSGSVFFPNQGSLPFAISFNYRTELYGYGFKYVSDTIEGVGYNIFLMDFSFFVPINFGKVIVTPYATAGLGSFREKEGTEFDFYFGYMLGAGLEVAYDAGNWAPFIGIGYSGLNPSIMGNIDTKNSVDVKVGIKFVRNASFNLW